MARVCEYCTKKRQHGNSVSHSKRRTKMTFKANLHMRRVVENGVGRSAKLCTKCINLLKKREIEGVATPFQLKFHKVPVEA